MSQATHTAAVDSNLAKIKEFSPALVQPFEAVERILRKNAELIKQIEQQQAVAKESNADADWQTGAISIQELNDNLSEV